MTFATLCQTALKTRISKVASLILSIFLHIPVPNGSLVCFNALIKNTQLSTSDVEEPKCHLSLSVSVVLNRRQCKPGFQSLNASNIFPSGLFKGPSLQTLTAITNASLVKLRRAFATEDKALITITAIFLQLL